MLLSSKAVRLTKVLCLIAFGLIMRTSSTAMRIANRFIYPDYCTKRPRDLVMRQSPPLDVHDQSKNLTLVQLHLIIRHGIRTPDSYLRCWENYNPVWNCEYDEAGWGVGNGQGVGVSRTFAFRKVFDANPRHNVFGGTCQKGQLLKAGAKQHRKIGQHLAASYFISENDKKIPTKGSPPLISSADAVDGEIYFRSTDMQRTRLSASNLLTSMLESAFPNNISILHQHLPVLHTMDYENDDMLINDVRCPLLNVSLTRALNSPGFREIEQRHAKLLKRLEKFTGVKMQQGKWPDLMMDCLFSHLCADRWDNIPDQLNPNGSFQFSSRELITQIEHAISREASYVFLHNNSSYARHGIAYLVQNIRSRIFQLMSKNRTIPKFYLWSGHDTTILPFLASFGSNVWNSTWPPYASIVALEIFETPGNDFLFRLIFNGRVISGGINGCHGTELCKMEHFVSSTSWVDDAIVACERSTPSMSG